MQVEVHNKPFPHLALSEVVVVQDNAAVMEAMEHQVPWTLKTEHFYEHFGIDLGGQALPPALRIFAARELLAQLILIVEAAFDVRLSSDVMIWAHRMQPGQGIGIHNDSDDKEIRLILNLNDGWAPENGGFLMLFAGESPATLQRAYLPINNSAVCFRTTKRSHHAVSEVLAQTRYTIVYVFSEDRSAQT